MDKKIVLILLMCIALVAPKGRGSREAESACQHQLNQQEQVIAELRQSVSQQQDLMRQLQVQLRQANDTIDTLRTQVQEDDSPVPIAEIQSNVAVLREMVLDQVEKSKEQEGTIAAQGNVITELRQNVQEQGGTIADLRSQQTCDLTELKTTVSYIQETLGMFPNGSASRAIGFTARMAGDYYRPDSIEPLPFTDVLVNHGGHFNPEDSRFTCPHHGLYYFSFSIYSGKIQTTSPYYRSNANLVHRSGREGFPQDIVSAYGGTGSETNTYMQSATSAVIECDRGDAVWVRPYHTDGNQMYGNHVFPRTVFTGFLIDAL